MRASTTLSERAAEAKLSASSDSTQKSPERGGVTLFGRTLFGEYLVMVLVVHSLFTALAWAPLIHRTPAAAVLAVVASIWVGCRALGVVPATIFSPAVTGVLVLVTVWIQSGLDPTRDPHVGFFSLPFLTSILIVVFSIDLTEFRRRWIDDADGRRALRNIVVNDGIRWLWYCLAGLVGIYVLVVPLVQEWWLLQTPASNDPSLEMDRLTLSENVRLRLFECFAACCFFAVGACVGSFLNVVIYRVPLGISVLVKPSHCPGCSEKVLGADNLPVVGWLKLNGVCRCCGTEISSRYPVVELTIGSAFLVLYFVELISGGANLPGRLPNAYTGVTWIVFYTKWDLVRLYLYHCMLICTLFSWAAILRDGHRVPLSSVMMMLLIFVGLPLIWPHLLPNPPFEPGLLNRPLGRGPVAAGMTSGLGIAAGMCVVFISKMVTFATRRRVLPDHLPSWLILGAALGWQAVVGVIALTVVWLLVSRVYRCFFLLEQRRGAHGPIGMPLMLPWILFVHHSVWRWLAAIGVG